MRLLLVYLCKCFIFNSFLTKEFIRNEIIVLNIDLENKKIVTNEDLLKLGNSSFEKIAEEHYNKTLESAKIIAL